MFVDIHSSITNVHFNTIIIINPFTHRIMQELNNYYGKVSCFQLIAMILYIPLGYLYLY